MRRKEFSQESWTEINTFLSEMNFGFLATIDKEGWPAITPLNFVSVNRIIYFHGSKIGQKMENIKANPFVSFAVAREYALIPSYFSDPVFACPVTSYFKSVLIKGKAVLIEDVYEKAEVLEAFMKKLQPEGGYMPIHPDREGYLPRIKGVVVVKLEVEEISAKFKFGQNLKDEAKQQVIDGLKQRGAAYDEATIEMMKKYCPHHREK